MSRMHNNLNKEKYAINKFFFEMLKSNRNRNFTNHGLSWVTKENSLPVGSPLIETTVDQLRVRENPNLDSNVIELLNEGEKLIFLGLVSSKSYKVNLRGKTFHEPFYKVRTFSGKTGWVYGGGVLTLDN